MDTHAYLLSQGWSGPGNPLNPNRRPGPHGGLGLTKPILIAQKKNTHGLGKQTTHDHANQWWLRGFEAALKGVGDDGSATPQSDGSGSAASGSSELYRFFVKGQPLEGTIDRIEIIEGKGVKGVSTASEKGEKKKKRKRSDEKNVDKEKREERALKKEKERKKCKVDERDSSEEGAKDGGLAVESKEERRRRRKEKKERKKEKGTTKLEEDSSDARADKKRRKKRQKFEDADSDSLSQGERAEANEPAGEEGISEKKVRKKQKKLEKEEKRARRELKHKENESKRGERS